MIKKILSLGLVALTAMILFSCQQEKPAGSDELSIDFDKYQLANGLDVVLHIDKSDPIVSLAILYHVGSNREVLGRTGFAHLFEHMMFQESENVGARTSFSRRSRMPEGCLMVEPLTIRLSILKSYRRMHLR